MQGIWEIGGTWETEGHRRVRETFVVGLKNSKMICRWKTGILYSQVSRSRSADPLQELAGLRLRLGRAEGRVLPERILRVQRWVGGSELFQRSSDTTGQQKRR